MIRYTRALPGDSQPVRTAKQQATNSAQRYINIRDCTERLLWLLCCNFDHKSAAFVTLTFDDAHLPTSRDGVKTAVQKLIRKARPAFRLRGLDFPCIYTVEGQPSWALPQADNVWETVPWKSSRQWDALDDNAEDELREEAVRLHSHMFLLLPDPEDRELLRSLWPHGRCYINHIRVNDFRSFERLAAYVTKESRLGTRPEHERAYVPSLGLLKPAVDGHWCGESEGIALPHGAERLRSGESHDDTYNSHCEWITYRFPRPATMPKPYQSKGRISNRQKPRKKK